MLARTKAPVVPKADQTVSVFADQSVHQTNDEAASPDAGQPHSAVASAGIDQPHNAVVSVDADQTRNAVTSPDAGQTHSAVASAQSGAAPDADLSIVDNAPSLSPKAGTFREELPVALSAPSARDAALAAFLADSIRNSLMDPHGVQFGGIAGLNWSGASASGHTGKISGKTLTGLTLGFFADVPLKKHLSFRPRIEYSYEGYQPDVNGERVNIHVAYLSVPMHIVYHTNLLAKRLFVGAGPYMAYGMNGTYTVKGINTDMQFGNHYNAGDNLRKMDYGASFMTGLLLDRNFVFGARFDLGLQNISPGGSTTQIHTRSAGLSIMYVFRNRANMRTSTPYPHPLAVR